MRRAMFVGLALSFLLVGFTGAGVGEASAPTTQGQIRFMGSPGCTLMFAYKGFPPGTQGRVDMYFQKNLVHTFLFDLPTPSGVVTLRRVGTFIPHPFHAEPKAFHGRVGFWATAQDSQIVITGFADIRCYCGGEGGGGGGGIGGGSGGSGTGLSESAAASPVTIQPSFTG